MSTIVTRATKGSALTWTEGDANITNLNNDKLENVVEDLTPQLGGDLDVNGKQIVSTANGNIAIVPNGSGNIQLTPTTGHVTISATNFPTGTGTNGQVLSTDGAGNASWATVSGGSGLADIVEDTTPQLGGNLDVNDKSITNSGTLDTYIDAGTDNNLYLRSLGNGNVVLAAIGTGQVQITHPLKIGDLIFPSGTGTSGQVLSTNGTDTISWTTPAAAFNPASPGAIGGTTASTGRFTTITSTATTGTAPFTVASTTNVANLNASSLNGSTFAAPGAIGSTTASSGAFTTLTAATTTLDDIRETIFALTYAATITPDAANGSIQTITLTGNVTFSAFANPVSGQTITLIITQDANGNRFITSTMKFAGGVRALSTAANSIDILTVSYIGTTYYASLAKGFV